MRRRQHTFGYKSFTIAARARDAMLCSHRVEIGSALACDLADTGMAAETSGTLEHSSEFDIKSVDRLVFFSDAVIAIIITLMVLEVRLPRCPQHASQEQVLEALVAPVAKYLAVVLSFLVIGLFWTLHHRRFNWVRHVDGQLVWINLLFLLATGMRAVCDLADRRASRAAHPPSSTPRSGERSLIACGAMVACRPSARDRGQPAAHREMRMAVQMSAGQRGRLCRLDLPWRSSNSMLRNISGSWCSSPIAPFANSHTRRHPAKAQLPGRRNSKRPRRTTAGACLLQRLAGAQKSMPPMPPIPPMPPPPPGIGGRGVLRTLGHHGLGRDQQAGDRGGVLQRAAHDLGRVDHALG